ncbi:MAG: Mur ligase family protein, partial [Candidatus Methylomirabilis sp.]
MAPRAPRLARAFRLAASALLPYAVVVATRHLDVVYLAQLERYKGSRLWGWITRHWRIILDPQAALIQAAVVAAGMALAMFKLHPIGLYVVWVAAGLWLAARRSSLQVSQRLQFTHRAIRLTAGTFVLAAAITLGVAMLAVASLSRATMVPRTFAVAIGLAVGLAVASVVAAATVCLANLMLSPLERAINGRFFAQARHRMRRYPGQVVGITGSYGKTTMKFITAALLGRRYSVLKTPDGVNTTMGITRVVREDLRDDHRFFVVEVAAYGPGEIREVCDILRPALGILTAVGVQHLERFGSLE